MMTPHAIIVYGFAIMNHDGHFWTDEHNWKPHPVVAAIYRTRDYAEIDMPRPSRAKVVTLTLTIDLNG